MDLASVSGRPRERRLLPQPHGAYFAVACELRGVVPRGEMLDGAPTLRSAVAEHANAL
jgi:hypothetical protein